jgi:hypothetical protein
MSDRIPVIQMDADNKELVLYRDGESGTWRLFIEDSVNHSYPCIDFTLAELRMLAGELQRVLAEIESDPNEHNAEVRRKWISELP